MNRSFKLKMVGSWVVVELREWTFCKCNRLLWSKFPYPGGDGVGVGSAAGFKEDAPNYTFMYGIFILLMASQTSSSVLSCEAGYSVVVEWNCDCIYTACMYANWKKWNKEFCDYVTKPLSWQKISWFLQRGVLYCRRVVTRKL